MKVIKIVKPQKSFLYYARKSKNERKSSKKEIYNSFEDVIEIVRKEVHQIY